MEALRESFLNLTFQMSLYKRATLDEEDLVDSAGDDVYPSSPMQVKQATPPGLKISGGITTGMLPRLGPVEECMGLARFHNRRATRLSVPARTTSRLHLRLPLRNPPPPNFPAYRVLFYGLRPGSDQLFQNQLRRNVFRRRAGLHRPSHVNSLLPADAEATPERRRTVWLCSFSLQ